MALADITPAQVAEETLAAKRLASEILALAAYIDRNEDALWAQYGATWRTATNPQKNAIIQAVADSAGVPISPTLVTWIRSFVDIILGDRYKDALLAKLRAKESSLQTELAAVQQQIADLEG